MVTIQCAHCGDTKNYLCSFERPQLLICLKCIKFTWTKTENQHIKTGLAFSRCPKKCKIGKLDPEIREKIDRMLIGGLPYEDLIQQYPQANLNIANLSTHKNKHLHPYFLNFCRWKLDP